jgi:hypothetical protein
MMRRKAGLRETDMETGDDNAIIMPRRAQEQTKIV